MKILYFDCFSGISGDMTIGALLDLGIDREKLLKELSRLELDGYRIDIGTKTVNGINGVDVNVVLADEESAHDHETNHGSEQTHEHDHGHESGQEHNHEQAHEHDHDHEYGHDQDHTRSQAQGERGLIEIEQIIDHSSLNNTIKSFSKKVFREIAAAEAKVHGKSINEVHFHEVGAIDSIVDIVGTAICLELLGVEKVYSSPLHDGSGFIECRHGIIPVPVPAVMEMLCGSGIPLVTEDVGTELVTPTGMGIIKSLASGFGVMPAMKIEKTGYGYGKRNTGRLNALRVILGETLEDAGNGNLSGISCTNPCIAQKLHGKDEIIVLETNIDDTTSEVLGYTMAKLLEAGALDVFFTPVFMKKNRPAYMMTVLAKPGSEDTLAEIVLTETSTLGIRARRMERYCMERETMQVETVYGKARLKIASLGQIKKASPEYEDCRKIAQDTGMPLQKVYELVKTEANKQQGL